MTETRSARLELVRYGSGADSPSRLDWEETMQRLEERAAYDDGTRVANLPTIEAAHPGRYIEQGVDSGDGAGSGRVLWRADADRRWQPVGGDTVPRLRTSRALEGQARTGLTWRVSHPDLGAPTVAYHWDGSSEHAGRVSIFDPNTVAGRPSGVLHLGIMAEADPAVLGRLHVRTRYAGDRAIVARAHDSNAGNLLSLLDPGNQEQVEVDAFGRSRWRQPMALGGALPADALTAKTPLLVGPGVDAGTLGGPVFHGRKSRPDVDVLTLQRFEPGSTDVAPVARFGTSSITLGRNDGSWASDSRVTRGAAALDDTGTWTLSLTPTDRARANSGYREAGFSADEGLYSTLGLRVHNLGDPSRVANKTIAYGAGRLQEWAQGKTGVAHKVAAYLTNDGRMIANAPWRSAESDRPVAPRDIRQSLIHHTIQRWVLPGQFGLYRGPLIPPGDKEFAFNFPMMRVRSGSPTNLFASMRLETLTFVAALPFSGLDRVVLNLYMALSINGQPFQRVDPAGWEMESVGMTTSPVAYAPGDSTTWTAIWKDDVPSGSTFQWRFVLRNSDGRGPIRLRRADLAIHEAVLENYPQEGEPPLGYNLSNEQKNSGIW